MKRGARSDQTGGRPAASSDARNVGVAKPRATRKRRKQRVNTLMIGTCGLAAAAVGAWIAIAFGPQTAVAALPEPTLVVKPHASLAEASLVPVPAGARAAFQIDNAKLSAAPSALPGFLFDPAMQGPPPPPPPSADLAAKADAMAEEEEQAVALVPLPVPRPTLPGEWDGTTGSIPPTAAAAGVPLPPTSPFAGRTPVPVAPGQQLASLTPADEPVVEEAAPEAPAKPQLALPGSTDSYAIYDIKAKTVYMPSGDRLEAHSGFGEMMDDVRYVHVKMRGVTPPNTYDLSMRERPFHGVEALRLTPVGGREMYNRNGLLTHSYLLGPRGDSNGCISFKDYDKFLAAYKKGHVTQMIVVEEMPAGSVPPSNKLVAWLTGAMKKQ